MTSAPSHDFVPFWGIHASLQGRPQMCDFARSEADAEHKLQQLRAGNPDAAQTEYWVVQMTRSELAQWQAIGRIPADAEGSG